MQRAPQNEQKADRRLEGEKHRKSNNPVSSRQSARESQKAF